MTPTEGYHARNAGCFTNVLGRTGLTVSGAAFGGYRVTAGSPAHRAALRAALLNGINIVDTSSNYADGGSERLVGQVIAELEVEGALRRDEVVVVTKGGYIQGSNYEMASERAAAGSGFPEVVEYGPGLWHSISPEFLHDQITRSLDRLGMSSVDVYLLHNPEYYLGWASKAGVGLAEARAEYYRRIRNAFAYLEQEVERGRIRWYGISSNSFPHAASEADFTSLEECVKIAEMISLIHHFAVVQFPANLYERGFVAEANQSGGRTLIEYARAKNLGVLINRPLNALAGRELIRIADFPQAAEEFDAAALEQGIAALADREQRFIAGQLDAFADDPEARAALADYIALAPVLRDHWRTFGTIEHYTDLLGQYFAPRFNAVAEYFRDRDAAEHIAWYDEYLAEARALMRRIGVYYARPARERSDAIRASVARALQGASDGSAEPLQESLSSIAVRMLLGVSGVDSVLVGMRRPEYVDDVIGALRRGPLGDEGAWRRLEV